MFGHKSFLRLGELTDSSITGLYKNAYELVSCKYSFGQGIDQNGKVQTDVMGGTILISYANIPPAEFIQWMLKSNKLHNGSIVICDANDMPIEKLFFEDAACIGMEMKHTKKDRSYSLTKMKIQVRKFTLESVVHENRWTNLKS